MIRNLSSLSAGNGYVVGVDAGGRMRASFHADGGDWPFRNRLVRTDRSGLTAAVVVGGKGYLFRERDYVRITPGRAGQIDEGYPRSVEEWGLGWGDFGRDGIDAAFAEQDRLFVFAGDSYIAVSDSPTDDRSLRSRMSAVDPGYPKPLSDWGLDAFGFDRVDAAFRSSHAAASINAHHIAIARRKA